MKNRTLALIQKKELTQLLEDADGDPVLAPQIQEQLEEVEQVLRETANDPIIDLRALPRTAIFFRGGPVLGSHGVRPALAGEALIQYEKMFIEQAKHLEREIAQGAGKTRRPKGTPNPGLLFTGTPRGSFGLEFVAQPTDDLVTRKVYTKAIETVTTAIVRIGSGDKTDAESTIGDLPPLVLRPMKIFMKTLAAHGAELRVAFHDRTSSFLSAEQVTTAVALLETEVEEKEIEVTGVFKGVTLQSGYFDFVAQGDSIITGTVSEDVSPDQLLAMHKMTNQPCTAFIRMTTKKRSDGESSTTFVLVGVKKE